MSTRPGFSRSYQKLEETRMIFPKGLWREHGSANILISNFLPPELLREYILLFHGTQFVMVC